MTGSDRPHQTTPSQVDPARLTVILERSGWSLVGGRRGKYNRLQRPSATGLRTSRSLIIPLDRTAPDFNDLMTEALTELSDYEAHDQWFDIAPRLSSEPTDEFKFRKESAAPSGLISWKQGEELVASARSILVAGAKSHLQYSRRFSNRFGQFANRYIDTVLMGQTEVGSYVVTAFAPTSTLIPISSSKKEEIGLPGIESVASRSVTESVARALQATEEALAHYRSTGSFAAFDDGVRRGVSYDLASALYRVARDSSGGEIVVQWDPASPPSELGERSTFEFSGGDAPILESAAHLLGSSELEPRRQTVIGRVHLLAKKESGGPGVFGLETLGSQGRRYRVRLFDSDEYHDAVTAHEQDLAIIVHGTVEKEGTLYWIYNAKIERILGPLSEFEESGRLQRRYHQLDSAQLEIHEDTDGA